MGLGLKTKHHGTGVLSALAHKPYLTVTVRRLAVPSSSTWRQWLDQVVNGK